MEILKTTLFINLVIQLTQIYIFIYSQQKNKWNQQLYKAKKQQVSEINTIIQGKKTTSEWHQHNYPSVLLCIMFSLVFFILLRSLPPLSLDDLFIFGKERFHCRLFKLACHDGCIDDCSVEKQVLKIKKNFLLETVTRRLLEDQFELPSLVDCAQLGRRSTSGSGGRSGSGFWWRSLWPHKCQCGRPQRCSV